MLEIILIMKKLNNFIFYIKKQSHHIYVFFLFILISLSYFYPVLEDQMLYQSDIVQYTGMAKEHIDFREENNSETYWTDSAFSGMPTYLLGAKYPHNYIKELDLLIRFLPRPADYLFTYLLSFYILLLVLKVDYKIAFLGSLFFAFSTYLIIILGAGHNSKAHAIGYMPLVISGILLVYNNKYYLGFFLSTLALALEICTNHFQMTYYLMFIVITIGLIYLIDSYKKAKLNDYFQKTIILFCSLFIALGLNASTIMSTYEYSKESTRGNNEITIKVDGSIKENKGLDYDYINEFSYGLFETFNLVIPNIIGGGSIEELDTKSKTYKYLKSVGASTIQARQIVKSSPTYWGKQPIVEAPAYIGIVVVFLFVMSLFVLKTKHKKWLIISILISLLLSYGKNFSIFTDLFVNYFPFYDKFRAVSSIQVILELCIPVLAILGLNQILKENSLKNSLKKNLNTTLIVFISVLMVLYFSQYLLSFSGLNDKTYEDAYGIGYIDALKLDRINMYNNGIYKSFFYIVLLYGLLYYYIKKILSKNRLILILILVSSFDLISVNKKYLNSNDFVDSSVVLNPYSLNDADRLILNDKSKFRVMDLTNNSTKASYFHNSILGYHAAKLSNYNALLDFYVYKNHIPVLNMLNTKYFIQNNEQGKPQVIIRDSALGNAWFIEDLINVKSQNEALISLDTLNLSKRAVSTKLKSKKFIIPEQSNINLVNYKSNYLKYQINNSNESYVVFSEIYYKNGWKAYLNDKLVTHDRINVALRGINLPKGNNIVEFYFDPDVVIKSAKISLVFSLIFIISLFVYLIKYLRKKI